MQDKDILGFYAESHYLRDEIDKPALPINKTHLCSRI